jgi:hypothetical protein
MGAKITKGVSMGKPIKLELKLYDISRIQQALEMLIDYYQTSDNDFDKLYAKQLEETYDRVINQT